MKKVFLALVLVTIGMACDKSTVNNVVENPNYAKKSDNQNNNNAALTLREYLISNGYDTNGNGTIDPLEVSGLTTLNLSGKSLTSLDGLEMFTSLTEADFSNNNIREVTIGLPNLTKLNLSNNKLTQLDISRSSRLVDNLDIRGNAELNCVRVSQSQLTSYVNNATNTHYNNRDYDGNGKRHPFSQYNCR